MLWIGLCSPKVYIPLLGGSEGKASACIAGDLRSIPGWGRSAGEGNDNPLQCSCLESSMDRGAWWATARYDWVTNFHFFQDLYAEVLTPDVTVFRDDTFKEVIKVKWGGKVDPNPTGFADLQEEKGNSPFLFLLLPLILPVSPPPPRKMLCEQKVASASQRARPQEKPISLARWELWENKSLWFKPPSL